MRKLTAIIFIFAFLVSCSDDSTSTQPDLDPPNEEPQIIGTWKVFADSAVWIGSQISGKAAASQDTVTLETPDKRSLSIIDNTTESVGSFRFIFIDSTLTVADDFTLTGVEVSLPGLPSGTEAFGTPSGVSSVTQDFTSANVRLKYKTCLEDLSGFDDILIFKFLDNENPVRTYQIKANGFIDAVEKFVCTL